MAANPIAPSELRELANQLQFRLTAWYARLIYRLDDAVLAAALEPNATALPKPSPAPGGDLVPASDRAAVRSVMSSLRERKAAEKAAKGGAHG